MNLNRKNFTLFVIYFQFLLNQIYLNLNIYTFYQYYKLIMYISLIFIKVFQFSSIHFKITI